jgi:AraC-like DNA-binding protein
MFVQIGTEITFFGCGLCLLRALELLISKDRRTIYGALCYFFNGILMLGLGLTARGVPPVHPESIFLLFTSLFMVGPLDFFYYHTLLYPGRPVPFRTWLHYIPAMVCLVFEIVLQMQPYAVKQEIISSFFSEPLNHVLIIPLAAVSLHVFIYSIIIIKTALSDVRDSGSSKGLRFILYCGVTIILIIALLLGGFISGSKAVFVGGCILNVSLHVEMYIGTRVYTGFFDTLKQEIRNKRYEKSMLIGLDTDIIKDRLHELMSADELFRDSEISLAAVAERLSITPHQLSQLLNERMDTRFWDFVNRYRIEEAKKLLRDNPDANIISVCFQVGFNTKSTFNSAFKKMAGMTPREFKQYHGE